MCKVHHGLSPKAWKPNANAIRSFIAEDAIRDVDNAFLATVSILGKTAVYSITRNLRDSVQLM
jgi:hypothetical protein